MKAKDFLYKLIFFSWLSMIVFKYFKQVENRHLFLNFPQRSDVHPKLLGAYRLISQSVLRPLLI